MDHLKALPVVLVLAAAVLVLAKTPACMLACRAEDYVRRCYLWFAVTLLAFLSHNFWVCMAGSGALLYVNGRLDRNVPALFFFMLFAIPPIEVQISGLGLMEHFFSLTYGRLLALTVLLPAWLTLRKQPGVEPFGRSLPDKILAAHMVLFLCLILRASTLTNSLRHGVLYSFLDIFLPYYVLSRSLRTLQDFRDALTAFVVAALVLSAIALFEYAKGWLLFVSLDEALGVPWWSNYLSRGETVRAQVTASQPIPLGYAIAAACGLYLYVRKLVPDLAVYGLGALLLIGGLIAPISRGPWIGAALIVFLFIMTGPRPLRWLAAFSLLGIFSLPVLLYTPFGEKILDTLPFIGTVESINVIYRKRLFDVASVVIMQRPWFGAFDYLLLPEMQTLKQGQGIIDVVNTYLQVGLERGLVGVALFLGFFLVVAAGIFRGMRRLPSRESEAYVLGQALLATLLGVIVMIVSVSSISIVPVIYWSMAGLGVAYARLVGAPALVVQPALAPRAIGARA